MSSTFSQRIVELFPGEAALPTAAVIFGGSVAVTSTAGRRRRQALRKPHHKARHALRFSRILEIWVLSASHSPKQPGAKTNIRQRPVIAFNRVRAVYEALELGALLRCGPMGSRVPEQLLDLAGGQGSHLYPDVVHQPGELGSASADDERACVAPHREAREDGRSDRRLPVRLEAIFRLGPAGCRFDVTTVSKMAGHASVLTSSKYHRRGEDAKRKAAKALHVPYPGRPRNLFTGTDPGKRYCRLPETSLRPTTSVVCGDLACFLRKT